MERGAEVSDCGRYRYLLTRVWRADAPALLAVGLNPSVADAARDDPTSRRLLGFARAHGFGSLLLVNLYAWRATKRGELRGAADPVGPGADEWIRRAAVRASMAPGSRVWVVWGALDAWQHGRARNVVRLLRACPMGAVRCLGMTKNGHPRHPLYLRGDTRAEVFDVRVYG